MKMGGRISLFSGYEQYENRTTNYCLLVLKLIYEENPKTFAEVLALLLNDESLLNIVGVQFFQQSKKENSTPDGLITQESFAVYIETKHGDWFYDDQLERHIKNLSKEPATKKILIALGLFDESVTNKFSKIKGIAESSDILFTSLSYEQFISVLSTPELLMSKRLQDTAKELRAYLDENGQLPKWASYLDVINCAGIPEDILLHNVYMCPATGGAYSHYRCKYFGMYKNKAVIKIAEIRSVVDVLSQNEAIIKWVNTPNENNEDILREAINKVINARPDEYPTRVFLLGELHDTSFVKDSPGGMLGSKQYFDISKVNAKDPKELAQKLSSLKWSDNIFKV